MRVSWTVTAAAILTFATFAAAGVVQQGAGETFVGFLAGDYDSIAPEGVMTDNGDGTLVTAVGHNDGGPATLTYLINFATPGEYYWYFNYAAASSSEDSMFVVSEFDVEPTSDGNSNRINAMSGTVGDVWMILNNTAGADVIPTDDEGANPDYNGVAAIGETFTVAEAGQVSMIVKSREPGLIWNAFVLSTNPDHSATELNAIVPEPTTIGLLGMGVLGVLRRRRG